MAASVPYILTLKLDQHTFSMLNMLRQTYFPADRNIVPAHVTLFHALPGAHETVLRQDLEQIASTTRPISLTFPRVQSLGRGVAIALTSPELAQLRHQLARRWWDWLSRQDQQPYHPHVTIQNKVTSEAARQLYAQLSETWEPVTGVGEGLILWEYVGGPWNFVSEYPFTHSEAAQRPLPADMV